MNILYQSEGFNTRENFTPWKNIHAELLSRNYVLKPVATINTFRYYDKNKSTQFW